MPSFAIFKAGLSCHVFESIIKHRLCISLWKEHKNERQQRNHIGLASSRPPRLVRNADRSYARSFISS